MGWEIHIFIQKKSGIYHGMEDFIMLEFKYDTQLLIEGTDLDEDEIVRFVQGDFRECPYYQVGDEYRVVRKQM